MPTPASEAFSSQFLQRLKEVIVDNERCGYAELLPFNAVRASLARPDSIVRRLFVEVARQRPEMDLLNLLSTIAGTINFACEQELGEAAGESICSREGLEAVVDRNWTVIWQLATTKNNSPTIPQRAISLACHLPSSEGRHGVLELGCSRGDIGRVLLATDIFLRDADKWFFPSWRGTIPNSELKRARRIDSYLGIDLQLEFDDRWLLALWGLRDPRRESLKQFYAAFPPCESPAFRRLEANLTQLAEYQDAVLNWLDDIDQLTVVTSFVLYQLTPEQRRLAMAHAAALMAAFHERHGLGAKAVWLNQGLPAEDIAAGAIELARLEVSLLEPCDGGMHVRPLARLANDACEGWQSVDRPATVCRRGWTTTVEKDR